MSQPSLPWAVPMRPRDVEEENRTATPLELFFDLVFVVAVASAAERLHHGLAEGHLAAIAYFVLVFLAIWWAWVNYTWFASAYDSGDVVFRLLSFVIMAGSLMLAAAIPDLFADGQSGLAVAGYCVMRLAMVALWLRAARGHPEGRRAALVYAAGITLVQAFWVARLLIHDSSAALLTTFALGMALEFTVPWVAERRHRTPYHPDHIAERYGLFTIIVLGEVVLSSVLAVQQALDGEYAGDLVPLVVGGLLLVFSLWWIYFKRDHAPLFASERIVFRAAFAHLVIFAAVAATGAGLAVAVDVVTHHGHASEVVAAWAVAVPTVLFLLAMGLTFALGEDRGHLVPALLAAAAVVLVTAVALALEAAVGVVVLLVGLVCAASVAQHVVQAQASSRVPESAP